MKLNVLKAGLLLLCVCTPSLASNYWYCPQTSSYIHLGDSPAKVEATCGKPDKTQMQNIHNYHQVTQWVYNRHSVALRYDKQLPQKPLVIEFEAGLVKSIKVLHQAVSSTTFCNPRQVIAIGDNERTVQAACGAPDYTQNISVKNQQNTSQTIVYTYNQSYDSPITLTFKGFKLVSIE